LKIRKADITYANDKMDIYMYEDPVKDYV